MQDSLVSHKRGQSPIDFSIGVSIFLVAVTFVVLFVPSVIAPFDRGAGRSTVGADAVAVEFTERLLGGTESSGVADLGCARGAFVGESTPCGYQGGTGAPSFETQVGGGDTETLYVAIQGDADEDGVTDKLCASTDETVVEADAPNCDVVLEHGNRPETTGSVDSAVRVFTLESTPARLVVEVA